MKVLIIVDDYLPDSIKIAAKMMHELACELSSREYNVDVLTPDSKIKQITINKLDNIKVIRFKSGEIKNVSKIKRAINESLLSFRAYKQCKKILKNENYNLIIYYSPSIFWGYLIKKLKNKNNKTYLILRDIFPKWAIDNKILKKNSPITKYFEFFEKLNYKHADKIGLMSKKNLEDFNKFHKNKYNTELLYNWTKNIKINRRENYRKKLNLENKIIYFYGGNMGQAQDMMNLVRLSKKMLEFKNAIFLFVGLGDELELIKENTKNQENVLILPPMEQNKFKELLSQIDIGLFTLNYNHKTHNFPGKLLSYMSESKAILGSINPKNDLKEIIENANAGYITVNGQDDLLFDNAKKFLNKNTRIELGKNANILLNDLFSVESAANTILEILN